MKYLFQFVCVEAREAMHFCLDGHGLKIKKKNADLEVNQKKL